jgi:uncharacterized protein (DUF58 family)
MLLDEALVEKAALGLRFRLPRGAPRGRVGDVRTNSVGSSLELHDFRLYQPGDDVRHIDWNAAARTGEVVLRVRREEVSPRFEAVLDASRSMSVSGEKAALAREVSLWTSILATRAGLDIALTIAGAKGQRVTGPDVRVALRGAEMQGQGGLGEALRAAPPLRPCGVRVVVSDFLFEEPAGPLIERWARQASELYLVQVLDSEDLDPTGGAGVRLVDAESNEFLERILGPSFIASYRERFAGHQKMWRDAARRVGATMTTVSTAEGLASHARGALAPLAEVG